MTGVFPEFGLQVIARGTAKARFCGMGGQVVPTSWRRSWIRCPDCQRKFNVTRKRRLPTHVMNPKAAA